MKNLLSIILLIIALIFFINIPVFTTGLLIIIWGIYQFIKNRKMKKKSKLVPVLITSGIIILFIGFVGSDEDHLTEDETEDKEEINVFIPEMRVLNEVVDEQLHISGKTNLPDETMLVVTVVNQDSDEIEIESSVDSGTFEIEPILVKELKPGKQTYSIKLADNQLSSVIEVIGEDGELLDGDLIDQNEFLLTFNVEIPNESPNKIASNDKQVEKKSKPTHTSGTTDKVPVTLVRTIDGDTIKVIYDGQEHNVRYLLIDTPETNHPRLGKQPFGEEAKEKNHALVNSGDLYLEFDVGERLDKYGRLLAYVYVGDTLVQEQLLKEGLARVAYVYPPNTRHLDRFEKAEKIAKDKKIGIWSLEDYVSDNGFNASSKSNSSSEPKQAKQSSNKSKPANSSNEVYYKNCTEARNAGVTPIYKGELGYAKHLDRDGDGIACE